MRMCVCACVGMWLNRVEVNRANSKKVTLAPIVGKWCAQAVKEVEEASRKCRGMLAASTALNTGRAVGCSQLRNAEISKQPLHGVFKNNYQASRMTMLKCWPLTAVSMLPTGNDVILSFFDLRLRSRSRSNAVTSGSDTRCLDFCPYKDSACKKGQADGWKTGRGLHLVAGLLRLLRPPCLGTRPLLAVRRLLQHGRAVHPVASVATCRDAGRHSPLHPAGGYRTEH